MTRYVSGFLSLVCLILLFSSLHFHALSNQQHLKIEDQQKTISEDEQANQSLMTTASMLNARNNTLVRSLNDRSSQLAAEKRRADADRSAYQQALSDNHGWAGEHVPESVSRVLYAATHPSVPNDSTAQAAGSK
ncbi:hypothetical protein LMG33818_000031 [Halomonadaceae bacterium LMG 33818]|uniref:hypothetical protein n=1 Tax=Cernens ardua TaxID=3402176 RepID=UPI003EDBCE34